MSPSSLAGHHGQSKTASLHTQVVPAGVKHGRHTSDE